MKQRYAARAVILNENNNVLLLECKDTQPVNPKTPHINHYWITPGGGLEPDETHHQALKRELHEELAIQKIQILDHLDTRSVVLNLPEIS
ncbi:hypothetical protein KS4_20250 [Poriferisphaera corsica]|uniref:Nudix hydrolase domain-containing protein n=1 Tax=Poriferisphaera corsica TaxID=2528020 RepID=A0A517YUT4_9BACT|nr:NUDIX domain-containing protein [Poriferisphaera corsica]QDU33965.1 hypothetical protein KS4_20250 [Poriferisphaera corsica]